MNRVLQNGYFDRNGLDLTLRLGIPGSNHDHLRAAAVRDQQQNRYHGFFYGGPYTNQPIIMLDIQDIAGRTLEPVEYVFPQVFSRRVLEPIVCYGPIRPGGEPEMYWGFMAKSFVTVHLPPPNDTVGPRTHFRTGRTRTYATNSDQMCNNVSCNATVTSMWRKGPFGPKTLCNGCGIEFRKLRDTIAGMVERRMDEMIARANIQMPDNL